VARYRVIHWKEIPSLVEAFAGEQVVRVQLSQRFQDLIDALAMREEASESGAYLDGWGQSAELDRPGGPEDVAQQIAAELEANFGDLLARRFLPPASTSN
jgi:Virulence factor